MRLSKIFCGLRMTLNIGPYEFMRPEGASEVELDFFDNRKEALKLASEEAVKAFKVSALTQAEMYDKLNAGSQVTPKVKKWLKELDIEKKEDGWSRKEKH